MVCDQLSLAPHTPLLCPDRLYPWAATIKPRVQFSPSCCERNNKVPC